MKLTRQEANRFLLLHQHLLPPRQLVGKEGVHAFVRHVHSIQFDPLNVVGRNPDLVLQARVADYVPGMLDELLYSDFALVDGWDKMACIYSSEDWPFFARRRKSERQRMLKRSPEVFKIISQVRADLEARGPLSSIDLDYNDHVDWPWGPTRMARATLDGMHTLGQVIVHHRVGSRKVYDLAERHVPAEILNAADPNVSDEQYQDWYMLRRLGSVGLLRLGGGPPWMGMVEIGAKERTATAERLRKSGRLFEFEIEGLRYPYYVRAADMPLLEQALSAESYSPSASLVAPLDNLLWARGMVRDLFEFDYKWEVYKPAATRKYGYYVLPVLYGERFVARCEPIRDREAGRLILKNWWWEPDVQPNAEMEHAVDVCLECFASYLGLYPTRLEDAERIIHCNT